ncbi:MAG: response regulator [Abitibacteriaceae bacterium]|nr:response regulator [Abditibacteriaceae bacterium]MBV9867546.1 response regulator [Abditibacteriaceae bacterium]
MLRKLEDALILIVDDQEPNVLLLEGFLEGANYTNIKATTDPREVIPLYQALQPDLILLDLHMSPLDGFDVMEQLQEQVPFGTYLPILVLTADITLEAKKRALSSGARDFLTKPFDHAEVLLRIHNLLETRFLHLAMQSQNDILEEKVHERTLELRQAHATVLQRNEELKQAELETLERLAIAVEYRDDITGRHTQRVGQTAGLLAMALGLPPEQVGLIQRAAPLHDIGKIGIPDAVLLKAGKLQPEEFEIIKTHTTIGAKILSGSRSTLLQLAEEIALSHHERWEGSGYPRGLSGEAIPLSGRIVTVADVFDALTHERPYKKAWSIEDAVAEIERQSGQQFDPHVVNVFKTLPSHALA